jgi:hypothetical protein
VGGAAWSAHADPDPQRHHRPIGTGPGKQFIQVVAEVGEDGLEVGLAERSHRPTGPILVIVERPRSRTGHRDALSFWWC